MKPVCWKGEGNKAKSVQGGWSCSRVWPAWDRGLEGAKKEPKGGSDAWILLED